MTLSQLTDFIVQWTLHEWPQSTLDTVIASTGFTQHGVDKAFDRASEKILSDGHS